MWWFCLLFPLGLVSSQSLNETEAVANIASNPCTDKNHLVLAPGVLTGGSLNRACVSRFYTEGPARMSLTLLTEDRQMFTANRELAAGDGGCLDISAPQTPNSKADLVISMRYPEAQCVWERRVPLRISSGRVVVISTERARYRPGELVRLRILALRQDLAPSHGQIDEVWLEGPRGAWEGSRVTQWLRVRTRLGLAQLQYQLDELAPSGRWTLRAKLGDGSQGSAIFWVGNYELPPFQLSVRHAPRVLRTSERLVWTVCVRYPWSEAVEGMLVIRLRGAGGGSGGIRTAVQLRAPKACHRHAAAAKRVGLDGADPPDVVVADFSFQEEGTRIWQNTTVVSQVVDKPISLEFLTKHRAVIAPGLPYKLKVKATRWDDVPARNERVRVCRYPSTNPVEAPPPPTSRDNKCAEGTTDASGVARLLFAAGDDAAPFYRFQAHLSNDTTTSAVPLTLPVRRSSSMHAALGPLKAESRQTRTFVPLYLNTNATAKPYTVHFVVITRGGIIYRWGATTQCATSSSGDQIHTAPRNSKCNANVQRDVIMAQRDLTNSDDDPQKDSDKNLGTNVSQSGENAGRHDLLLAQTDPSSSNVTNDVSDALLDRHQLRVMLPIKVSHQMCPDSHLIAYFYHEGELISASKHFEMEECFGNKVEATWLQRQAQPGSTVSLQVSTPGPALCALTVLDTAAKWTQPPPSTKEQLMTALKRLIESHRNLTEYDAAGVCFLNADTPELPSTSIELTSSWLAAAGVRLIGGDMQGGKHCIPRPPALLITEETTVPRSDFSEAWLWRLLAISANGTGAASARAPDSITKFEASAVCVSRSGAAISTPAVLQVFREFFIHADKPKRLRRGDSTIIRYRIFNYLYEPLSVQIQILTDPHVEGPKDLVESACVGARSSIARRVEIRARVAAPARISIRAKAVSDGNCGNVTSGRTGVSDEVIIRIPVDPEGIPVREQKSILLCSNTTTDFSTSDVIWNWPPVDAVPGTETLTLWTVGDVTGPLLADADSLLQIPRGCGEQNMAQLATNLLALQQLDPSSIAALTAKEHVARGFTRQLQYVHPSGGFSAFGASDAISSTWLTAFVVRHIRKAHRILWPNLQVPPAIIRAERWLLNQQMENGCFRNEGQVFHRELRGGLNDEGEIASVALTAYVITSLIESTSPLPHRVIRNTLSCLRAFPPLKTKTPTRVYAHALLAYAYMKLENYEEDLKATNEASLLKRSVGGLEPDEGLKQIVELLKVASRSGEYAWWEASSLSTSIEATAYALQALRSARALQASGARSAATGAARWLAAHRSTSGGFVSTQDTLVALEALSAWSNTYPDTNLNVTARCSGLTHHVVLLPGVKVPDLVKIRPGERLTVNVEGTGCALVQATRAYNTLTADSSSQDKQLSVQVSVHTDGPFDCDSNGTSCFCAAVIEACVMWTGSFPEMALLEVMLPGGFGADAQRLYSQLYKPTSLLRRIELPPSNTRATFYLGTRDGSDTSGDAGHQCYNIHATGPKVKTRPAYARVQDYYAPTINDTQVYTIPEECPPRIFHDSSNEYRSTDNLYAKARAADNEDIIITHDFSFDDIPEGIPLEDPLYDHLTETENDRIMATSHQEIGRLQKPSTEARIQVSNVRYNTSAVAETVGTLEGTEHDNSNFDNIVAGYFSENEAAVTGITTIDKGIEKDNNFGSITSGYISTNDGIVSDHTTGNVVDENDKTNEGFIVDHNFESTIPDQQININAHDSIDKEQINLEKLVDSITNIEKVDNVNITEKGETDLDHERIDNSGVANFKTNTDGEEHSPINVVEGNVRPNETSVEYANSMEGKIREQINLHDIAENVRINEPSVADHNTFDSVVAVVASMNDDNNDRDPATQQIDNTVREKIIESRLKGDSEEVEYNTHNNLVQEIDYLNTFAHRQLNETQSKYDANQIDYRQIIRDGVNKNYVNQHSNNVVSSYSNQVPKNRENEIKRSFKKGDRTSPPKSENIKSDTRNKGVDNPMLTDFHVVDTDKDLEVPSGIEGPIPASVLPPPGYVPPPVPESRRLQYRHMARRPAGRTDKVLRPANFVPTPVSKSHMRMQRIPSKEDLSLELRAPKIPVLPTPLLFAPSPIHSDDFRRMHNAYTANPPGAKGPITTILPPREYGPPADLRRLQSIDTPNGKYFYFKPGGNSLSRQYFIPEG